MLSAIVQACKTPGRLVVVFAAFVLAACVPGAGPISGAGPAINTGEAVPVALLVPGGSGQATDELLARSLQNAARLAISDLGGVKIDLRVYNTAAQPGQAQAMAIKAADEGAKIILGPVYAQEVNAVGVAMAPRGITVLSFSNNTDVAGGNVFVLGPTFDNTARRLASYAVRSGKSRIMIVHDRDTAGDLGRAAIQRGVQTAGGAVVAVGSYELSQQGIASAIPSIAQTAKSAGANALFLTANSATALPLVSQLLTDNGMSNATAQMIGLARWDIPAAALALPGVQGGWFALPDPGLYGQFQNRYQTAFSEAPHPIAGLAYDGVAAIGALVKQGKTNALSTAALTQGAGYVGVNGIFRLRTDGTNERGLAIAQVRNNAAVIIDAAPRSFAGAGF
ncbi:MAG: penicillin-binding protein activator [Pseudomonadota bacterium]